MKAAQLLFDWHLAEQTAALATPELFSVMPGAGQHTMLASLTGAEHVPVTGLGGGGSAGFGQAPGGGGGGRGGPGDGGGGWGPGGDGCG